MTRRRQIKQTAGGAVVVFRLDDQRYGVLLPAVERVLRMTHVTLLPESPAVVAGIINYHGAIVPVINLRRRFGLAERDIALGDHLILADSGRRRLALWVEGLDGVADSRAEDWAETGDLPAGGETIAGIIKRADGLILIHDLEACLSLDEQQALDAALTSAQTPP
jgi:purine-binding chemotaxis protein CheW